MAEQPEIVRVRSLTSLTVIIGDSQISLSLARSSSESESEYLDELFLDLKRKVATKTSREFHSVPGAGTLDDDSLRRIFRDLYRVPYECDGTWKGCCVNTTGAFRLEEPASGDTANEQAKRVTTRASKTTSPLSDVSFYGVITVCDHCRCLTSNAPERVVRRAQSTQPTAKCDGPPET